MKTLYRPLTSLDIVKLQSAVFCAARGHGPNPERQPQPLVLPRLLVTRAFGPGFRSGSRSIIFDVDSSLLLVSKLTIYRAVYTGIKNPEFFSHSGLSLEDARQLLLNTAKKQTRKTHLRSVVFWNSTGFSLFFCQFFVNARSPLAGIIRVFGHVGRDLPRNHTRPATYCALRMVKGREKSLMRTRLPKKQYEIRVFSRMRFFSQKTEKLWVFLAV